MVAYNIVFAGETGVGKSWFIIRLFDLEVSPTSNDFLGASEERERCIAVQGNSEVLAVLSPRQMFSLPNPYASKLTPTNLLTGITSIFTRSPTFELCVFERTSVSILASAREADVAG